MDICETGVLIGNLYLYKIVHPSLFPVVLPPAAEAGVARNTRAHTRTHKCTVKSMLRNNMRFSQVSLASENLIHLRRGFSPCRHTN